MEKWSLTVHIRLTRKIFKTEAKLFLPTIYIEKRRRFSFSIIIGECTNAFTIIGLNSKKASKLEDAHDEAIETKDAIENEDGGQFSFTKKCVILGSKIFINE